MGLRRLQAVVFDVGEVIVNETREYGMWADWLGVPRHTFSAMFGAVLAAGLAYREVFQRFRPGFDLHQSKGAMHRGGFAETFGESDLYPGVRLALEAIKAHGIVLGLAGTRRRRAH